MPRQLARSDLAAVDVAFRIHRHAFGCAGAFHLEWIGNAVEDLALIEAADADAALPSRMRRDAVRLGIGDVDHAVADRDAARAAELLPLGDESAVEVEDLDAVVAAVGDEEAPLRIERDVVRRPKFHRTRAEPAERADEP